MDWCDQLSRTVQSLEKLLLLDLAIWQQVNVRVQHFFCSRVQGFICESLGELADRFCMRSVIEPSLWLSALFFRNTLWQHA